MNAEIKVREARSGDLPELLLLEQQRFTTDRISARSFKRWFRLQHDGLAVAEQGGKLVGNVVVLRRGNSRVAHLYSIVVDESVGRQGLGRLLLEWAEHRARSWGASRIRLEVESTNTAAQSFYLKFGYQLLSTKPAYYENGSDALCMQKDL